MRENKSKRSIQTKLVFKSCTLNVFGTFHFRVLTEANSKILEYIVEEKSTAFVSE